MAETLFIRWEKRGGTDLCFHGFLPCIYILAPSQHSYNDIQVRCIYTNTKLKLSMTPSFVPYILNVVVCSRLTFDIHKKEIRRRVVTLTLEVVTLGRAAEGDEIH